MEEEISAFEKLVNFATNTSRKVYFTEVPYPHTVMHGVVYHRRTLYIPADSHNSIFFVCFGDSRQFGDYANYSGVFFEIDIPLCEQLVVRKKDILDKIGSVFGKEKLKTGNKSFDSQVIFDKKSTENGVKHISNATVQTKILAAFDQIPLLRTGINELNPDFVPELKDKSHFGIYLINDWIYDLEKIENLFKIASEIKKALSK